MSVLRNIADGLRSLYRKEQVSRELEDELNGFLEMAVDEKVKQGMSRKDALRAVRLERGSLDVAKEIVWSARWETFVETLWRDLVRRPRAAKVARPDVCGRTIARNRCRGKHSHLQSRRCGDPETLAR